MTFDIAKASFKLPDNFVEKYEGKQPDWGPVGYFTFKRTYARPLEGGGTEEWWQTCRRVVEATFSIQKNHCKGNRLPWNERKATKTARKMFELMWGFKFLPPGRGLWVMGTEHVIRHGSAAMNNCGFVSTANIAEESSRPFCFIMDMSMVGVGVGFDTRGAGKLEIQAPEAPLEEPYFFTIPDSREGWVESLRLLIDAYAFGLPEPEFDYSKIRPEGEPIKGFGGLASGPDPLRQMHEAIRQILRCRIGDFITSEDIVDIGNLIGRCVVAGNVRRSSEIVLGNPDDKKFLMLKQDQEKLDAWRWNSNNSILAEIGMNYDDIAQYTSQNGEPGYFWINNARAYGRMKDPINWHDKEACGVNPCQPSWATVLTPMGIRKFSDIDLGDIIWSGKQWTTLINKQYTGVRQVNEYVTRAGSFIGTDTHRVVTNGQKVKVVNAESIDTSQGEDQASHLMGIPNMTDDYLRYIVDGLIIGDGSVHKASNNLVILHIGDDDQDYFDSEISNLIKTHRPGISHTAYEVNTTISYDELPKTYERQIPDRYRYGNDVARALFLRGLFSANGSLCGNRVTLKASSLALIKQVSEILSSLGIRSYYTVNKSNDVNFTNGSYSCKESYDLNISTDRTKFADQIGFIQKYKVSKLRRIIDSIGNSKYAHSKPKLNYDIVEINNLGKHEVFDITVDDPDHTYWTGGLLVSNCGEQTLHNYELCTLSETFPSRHDSLEEYLETLKIAYLYAKTVTLVPTEWEETNAVMMKNRRIGLSQSGIIKAFGRHGRREMFRWCDEGYKYIDGLDIVYANWLGVPRSIKKTSVKPSGTVSLLPGEPPGIHYPHSEYYIRRIRLAKNSPLVAAARDAGYVIEPVIGQESSTVVIEFPVHEEYISRGKDSVSIWEQVANAAAYQRYWADNQVSITVTFNKDEARDISHVLEMFEDSLKGISFLPISEHGYKQAPYETITSQEYEARIAKLSPISFDNDDGSGHNVEALKFCDGDGNCQI